MATKYDGVENEEARVERLPKLEEGEYVLEVRANKELETRKGPAILAEFKIVESTNETLKPGTTASTMFFEKDELFLSKLAAYARALTNAKKVTGSDIQELVSDENPAAGVKISVRVSRPTAKTSGRPYNKYDWRHVAQ